MSVPEKLRSMPTARVLAYRVQAQERIRAADDEALRYRLADPRRRECEEERHAAMYVASCAIDELHVRHAQALEAIPFPAWARERQGDWLLAGRTRARAGTRTRTHAGA